MSTTYPVAAPRPTTSAVQPHQAIAAALFVRAWPSECVSERTNTLLVSLQVFAVLLMSEAVVRRGVQALVGFEQCPFFGEQGKPLRFQLRSRHGALESTPTCELRAELALVSGLGDGPHRQAAVATHVQDVRRPQHDAHLVPAGGARIGLGPVLPPLFSAVSESRWQRPAGWVGEHKSQPPSLYSRVSPGG